MVRIVLQLLRQHYRKLNCDVALRGEPDQTLPQLADTPWSAIEGCCWKDDSGEHISPTQAVTDMRKLGRADF